MWSWAVFGVGAIGALAPEVVRLYSLRSDPEKFKWSNFYLVISLLFAALGGVVAALLPAVNLQSAFYTGIATPTIINAILKKTPAGIPKAPGPKAAKIKKGDGEEKDLQPHAASEAASFHSFIQGL